MNDEDTQPFLPVWDDDPTTEEIPLPVMPPEEPAPAPPPYVLPPPPVVRAPVESTYIPPVNPVYDRGRGATAALCFAALIIGAFMGYILFSFTAAQEIANIPPEVRVLTQTQTATATATETEKETKTVRPDPIEVTKTAKPKPAETKTVEVPSDTRTIYRSQNNTPQSCLNAIDAAEQYVSLARQRRGRGNDNILAQARQNFQFWSRECKRDSD